MKSQKESADNKAINNNVQQEKITRDNNPQYYNDYLISLVSSFFLHQAVCASQTTGAPVRINLIQNAKNTNGSSTIIDTIESGIYNFQDFCNAISKTEKINASSDVVFKSMMNSRNLFDKSSNVEIDKKDILAISNAHEAILATYAGTNKELAFTTSLTGTELSSFYSIYARNSQTAFNADVFEYPDGHLTPDAKEITNEMMAQDQEVLDRAMYFIVLGANRFQDQVASNSEDLNSGLEVNF